MSLRTPVSEKDHAQGSAKPLVELLEYGDYQCPHCGRAYWIIKDLQQQRLGNKLKIVFRNFPLSEVHPHAKMAAVAAEAAALQGRFWEMHDMLFENQNRLHLTALKEYAAALSLDMTQFEIDLTSRTLLEKVEEEFYNGMRSGVNATPTFFINGEKYNGDWEGEALLNYLNIHYGSD
jgi:protein-disulfide isomerase